MKKCISTLLAAAMALTAMLTSALAASEFRSDQLGFSLTLPAQYAAEVEVREEESGVVFYHTPSIQGDWTGRMGSITVLTPRSAYLTENHSLEDLTVIGMSEARIYLYRRPIGGVDAPETTRAAYTAVIDALNADYLRQTIRIDQADEIPTLRTETALPALTASSGEGSHVMTRGEIATLLYDLLDAENKDAPHPATLTDLAGDPCADAVGYLQSYGIITGYADGTFRPDAPVTRAAFVVLLHRLVFAPLDSWYGDGIHFSDIDAEDDHWALAYLTNACYQGLLSGYPDGTLRPNATITREETNRIVNRLLAAGADSLQR